MFFFVKQDGVLLLTFFFPVIIQGAQEYECLILAICTNLQAHHLLWSHVSQWLVGVPFSVEDMPTVVSLIFLVILIFDGGDDDDNDKQWKKKNKFVFQEEQ